MNGKDDYCQKDSSGAWGSDLMICSGEVEQWDLILAFPPGSDIIILPSEHCLLAAVILPLC